MEMRKKAGAKCIGFPERENVEALSVGVVSQCTSRRGFIGVYVCGEYTYRRCMRERKRRVRALKVSESLRSHTSRKSPLIPTLEFRWMKISYELGGKRTTGGIWLKNIVPLRFRGTSR